MQSKSLHETREKQDKKHQLCVSKVYKMTEFINISDLLLAHCLASSVKSLFIFVNSQKIISKNQKSDREQEKSIKLCTKGCKNALG